MRPLADESVDRQIVDRLRLDGHRVLAIAEMSPGLSDDDVLNLANRERAMLLTADKDFGELVFRQGRVTLGVVLIRLAGLAPEQKTELVTSAIREHQAEIGQPSALSRRMPYASGGRVIEIL